MEHIYNRPFSSLRPSLASSVRCTWCASMGLIAHTAAENNPNLILFNYKSPFPTLSAATLWMPRHRDQNTLNPVLKAAFRIHLILTWIRIRIRILGSTFGKSGSGSKVDPDPSTYFSYFS